MVSDGWMDGRASSHHVVAVLAATAGRHPVPLVLFSFLIDFMLI